MTRAGTIEVLQSDYTRTATMKGLTTTPDDAPPRPAQRARSRPWRSSPSRSATCSAGSSRSRRSSTTTGWAQTMLFAAQRKDLPMLTAGVIVIGIVYMLATLDRRHDDRLDEPAHPAGRGALMDVIGHARRPSRRSVAPAAVRNARRPVARRCACWSGDRPSSSATSSSSAGSSRAILGERITPYDPFNYFSAGHLPPSPEHWMGTDRLGRDVLSRVMVGSRDVLIVAPLAALLGVAAGTLLGPGHGLLPGHRRRRPEPPRRGVPGAAGHPRRAAHPGRARHLAARRRRASSGILFTPIVARTVRSAVLSERSSTTSPRPSSAASRACSSCRARSSRTSSGRPWSR